jgi:predicted MPP superfamily phosphohydrolase
LSGDLITSFLKRRLAFSSGRIVPVLDQFLEGTLPILFLWRQPDVQFPDLLIPLFLFLPISFLGSWLWDYLIYRTSPDNSPRIIRTTTRLREWRACHQPLARWQTLLNFEHFFLYRVIIGLFFRLTGTYKAGLRNTLNLQVEEYCFELDNLPAAFNGLRIMFLTDLHIDGTPKLADVVIDKIKDIEVDICLFGGDYRMTTYGSIQPALRSLRRIVKQVRAKEGIFGILGNHDCIEMIPDLEEAGIVALVNDAWPIARQEERIWLAGIDDPHFYKTHNLPLTFAKINDNEFSLLLSHSPEVCEEAVPYQPDFCLCGHTHGGQICLPGQIPIFTHCPAPRALCNGQWQYKGMSGFTSRGVGASGVPLRFNCPGEIAILTLNSRDKSLS